MSTVPNYQFIITIIILIIKHTHLHVYIFTLLLNTHLTRVTFVIVVNGEDSGTARALQGLHHFYLRNPTFHTSC